MEVTNAVSQLISNDTITTPECSILVQPNGEPFTCPTCLRYFGIGDGIILSDCLHEFCRDCIVATIHKNKHFIEVKCPFDKDYKCESFLTEREIRGLVSVDEYEQFIENNQRVALEVTDHSIIAISGPSAMASKRKHEVELVMPQAKEFYCTRCLQVFRKENGITSKDCGHTICKECIIDNFFKSQKNNMKCEFQNKVCGIGINESQIHSVLSELGLAEPLDLNKTEEVIIMADASNVTTMKTNLIRNEINFWCGICNLDCPIGQGVKLRTCSHHVCELCLRDAIKMNYDPEILCPYSKSYERCKSFLTHSEIENLTSKEEFQQFQQIGIKKATEPSEFYLLQMMEELSYIKTTTDFDCPICFVPCSADEGIKLRDCLHQLCLECFTNTVVHSEDTLTKCPFTDDNLSHCESFFQEREIRAIVSKEVYNKFLERKIKLAEHTITNTFHCKTVDCRGFGIIETGDVVMICGICNQRNCLTCKAIHKDQTCEDYQDSLTGHFKVTERYITELKTLGDVMNCPNCEALINKIAGCSWLQCTFCKTEICWATKGPRWGPQGRGDTSGGCRCKVAGKPCHPKCENCH